MSSSERTPTRPLPFDWIDLGGGRTLPRDIDRVRKRALWMLAAAILSPLVFLIALSVIPVAAMLAIADFLNESMWSRFRQISFEGCGDRCWARSYTLISTTLLPASAAIVAAIALWQSVRWFIACEQALHRGASPYGLTPRGLIALGPPRWAYLLMPVILALLLVLLAWIGGLVYDGAGSNWERGVRGVQSPVLRSVLWTALLVIVQGLVGALAGYTASMILHICKALRGRYQ